jgi:hypothetical protein
MTTSRAASTRKLVRRRVRAMSLFTTRPSTLSHGQLPALASRTAPCHDYRSDSSANHRSAWPPRSRHAAHERDRDGREAAERHHQQRHHAAQISTDRHVDRPQPHSPVFVGTPNPRSGRRGRVRVALPSRTLGLSRRRLRRPGRPAQALAQGVRPAGRSPRGARLRSLTPQLSRC